MNDQALGEPYSIPALALAADAEALLEQAGIARVVTCDSVPHASNDCAVDGLIAGGVAELARDG